MSERMLVIDASAVIDILLQTPKGRRHDRLFSNNDIEWCAPHLIDIEVVHVLRRLEQKRKISTKRAAHALEDWLHWSIQKYEHGNLLFSLWETRHNLSAYDAAYVSLAKALETRVLTHDGRLLRAAPQLTVPVNGQ